MWLFVLLFLVVVLIVIFTSFFRIPPFLVLLGAGFAYGLASGRLAGPEVAEALEKGFGGTVGAIGLVILFGTVIGTFLQKSGGAEEVAVSTLKLIGPKRITTALLIVGATVSVPVFCDSGFVVLSPLAFAMAKEAGVSSKKAAISLSLGLYATHTMVPPTPGPVAAAGLLGADLGLVILFGLLVCVPAIFAAWAFVRFFVPEGKLSLRPSEERVEGRVKRGTLQKALLPILLPLILIVCGSVGSLPSRPFGEGKLAEAVNFFGKPMVALFVGMLLSFRLLGVSEKKDFRGWISEAVSASAAIIIITGCGGAFGKVIQSTGITEVISKNISGLKLGILFPFLVAAGLKTAQGSSTVAMATTGALLAPLLGPLGLDSAAGKALSVVSAGAGSMVVSHANDSYFWVVTQFSGLTTKEGYRLQTLGTLVQGIASALGVYILSSLVL